MPRPVITYRIGNNEYRIYEQTENMLAVSVNDAKSKTGQRWLSWPEKRFESLGGCDHAILLDLASEVKYE